MARKWVMQGLFSPFYQSASHRHAAASKLRADLHCAHSPLGQLANLAAADHYFGTPADSPLASGSCEASNNSFRQANWLLARQRSEQAYHHVAEWPQRVDVALCERAVIDSLCRLVLYGDRELARRALDNLRRVPGRASAEAIARGDSDLFLEETYEKDDVSIRN